LTLSEIDLSYPAATWTYAENVTRNSGYDYIKSPGRPPISVSAPSGSLCSNYKAEILALHNATETLLLWDRKREVL
jgi:hypothetical protein